MLIDRTKLLEQAGCTVNGIACNTAHLLLPYLQAVTNVPFLSIPRLIAERSIAAGYERVGLLATPTTLESTLYDEALNGITEIERPNAEFADQIEQYIYKQLNSCLRISEREAFRLAVSKFMDDRQLDAVILGCTELPLVYGETNNVNILDTLQVLCDGLLKEYFMRR